MLIVVMFGFTSCSNTKDEVINRLISDKFEKQQYTFPPPLPSNISVTTDTTTARETSPLTNAIKNIIVATLEEYPRYFFGVDDLTYVRRLLYTPAVGLDSGSMNAIKNAILNPPHTADNHLDDIKNELIAINVGSSELVKKIPDSIRKNEAANMATIQNFCGIIDRFYEIESIRRDIINYLLL
jgi:hypothetical protein